MVALSRTFTVSQQLEKVTGYLSDFTHTQEWDPGTIECVREDTGHVRVGSRWVNTLLFMRRTAVLSYRLEALDPHRLVFCGENASATTRDELEFSEAADGTRITYRAQITFKGPMRFASPLVRLPFARLADRVVVQMTEVIDAL